MTVTAKNRVMIFGPSVSGSSLAQASVSHRMSRPRTTRTAPYYRLPLNAEAGGGANGHAGFAQPLRAARRYLQHRDRRRRPHRPCDGFPFRPLEIAGVIRAISQAHLA